MIKRALLTLLLILNCQYLISQSILQKYFRGNGDDWGNCIIQNFDNGYTIAGYSDSYGAGDVDAYLIRTDSTGSVIWSKTYGGLYDDIGYCVKQTPDSGFILVGMIRRTQGSNISDALIIKTDQNGDTLWTKFLTGMDWASLVELRSNGSFIIAGPPYISLAAFDSNGNVEWTKVFNHLNNSHPYSIKQSADGGFILTGNTKDSVSFIQEAFLLKIDSIGSLEWVKSYGGPNPESGLSAIQCSDGGYLMAGITHSFGAGLTDVYVIKTNSMGDTTWTKAIGTNGYESGVFVSQTLDGNIVISGGTSVGFGGNRNFYITKIDALGNLIWSRSIGEYGDDNCFDGKMTNDGGYILVGPSRSLSPLNNDIYFIKTDSSGIGGCNEFVPATVVNYTNSVVQIPNFLDQGNTISVNAPLITIGQGFSDTLLCNTATYNDLTKVEPFRVFPNPSSGIITLSSEIMLNSCSVVVTNVLSIIVFKHNYEPGEQIHINLDNIPNGTYIISISNNETILEKRIVVISK